MDKYTTYSDDFQDVTKYISGEMDAKQMESFESRLMSDPELNEQVEELKVLWVKMEYPATGNSSEIDTDSAWSSLDKRIRKSRKEVPEKETRVIRMPTWLSWAAAILLIAGLAWLAYMSWSPSAETPMIVYTNTNEELTMVKPLEDGSLVYLAGSSSIAVPQVFNENERIITVTGEAFIDVAYDAIRPFRVKAGNASIEVMGTSFNIKQTNHGDVEVFVETGRVGVNFEGERNPHLLEKGDLLKSSYTGISISKPEVYNTMWRKNLVSFRDEKFENVLFVLHKTFGYNFELGNQTLKDRVLTLTVYESSLETLSEMLALSLAIDYELTDNNSVVFKSRN